MTNLATILDTGLGWLYETEQPDDAHQDHRGITLDLPEGNRLYNFCPVAAGGLPVVIVKVAKVEWIDNVRPANPLASGELEALVEELRRRGVDVDSTWGGHPARLGGVRLTCTAHPTLVAAVARIPLEAPPASEREQDQPQQTKPFPFWYTEPAGNRVEIEPADTAHQSGVFVDITNDGKSTAGGIFVRADRASQVADAIRVAAGLSEARAAVADETEQLRAEVERLTRLVGQYADRGIENGQRAERAEARVRELETAAAKPPVDQTALRVRIAAALREHYLSTDRDEADADRNMPCRCGDWREPGAEADDENDWDTHLADVALAVLPATTGQTAEVERLREEHATWRKLGKRNLEAAHEESARLRADHAASLNRFRAVVRRLAAHAVGFQDVLDESDHDPWAKTVVADIAELRRLTADLPLSPYYSHETCGFHWHGRDGMDIPMRDGQPVCPRCELHTAEARALTEAADRLSMDWGGPNHEDTMEEVRQQLRRGATAAAPDGERNAESVDPTSGQYAGGES